MTREEAVAAIVAHVATLNPDAANVEFWATKLVLDVLDYCHREDFPEALTYAAAGALSKQLATSTDEVGTTAPLKALTQDDTKFEWATAEVDTTLDVGDIALNSLRPRLNYYRKLVAL